ncbi:MAG: START domain-containing protein [Thermodesulfobacteriota bacterium]
MLRLAMMIWCSLMALTISVRATEATENWRLSKKQDGIWVYTRPSATCSFNEFKGIIIIDAGIEVVGMVLKDIPSFPLWMSDCQQSPIIEKNGRNDYIFYFVQHMPWPVENRDTVLQARTTIDWNAGYFQVDFHSIQDDRIPPQPDCIRMKVVGRFLLEYIERRKTQVTYWIQADPYGSMPAVIANMISRKIPLETLQGMRKMVMDHRYEQRAAQSPEKLDLEIALRNNSVKRRKPAIR